MENLLKKIEELREDLLKIFKILDVEGQKLKIRDLKIKASKPDFWNNQEKAIEINKITEDGEKEVNRWEDLKKEIRELEELIAVGNEEKDFSIEKEANKKFKELRKKYNDLEFYVLFSGKYDENNAILSVHSGTGGVDAQDWTEILERMFLRFAEKKGFKTKIIDRTVGNEAGIKNSVIKISGKWAYGYFRSESGVHRLVRISPFDAEQMRHTSFALVEIIPEFPEIKEIKIKDEDLKIDVFKSSGPGGQGVNTTDSAVRITYKPKKITVTCQNERSQHQNKETAMNILKSKLFKLQEDEREKKELKLKGEAQKAEWGKQIRSYVMQPYKMVKDHRTEHETQDIEKVLNGNLEEFIEAYLRVDYNS